MLAVSRNISIYNLSSSSIIKDALKRFGAIKFGSAPFTSSKSQRSHFILPRRMKCDLCELLEVEGAKPNFIAPNLFKASLIIEEEERM